MIPLSEPKRKKRVNPLYPPIAALVKLFSPRYTLEGTENLPGEQEGPDGGKKFLR